MVQDRLSACAHIQSLTLGACAARVTVVRLCVCLSVCLSVCHSVTTLAATVIDHGPKVRYHRVLYDDF